MQMRAMKEAIVWLGHEAAAGKNPPQKHLRGHVPDNTRRPPGQLNAPRDKRFEDYELNLRDQIVITRDRAKTKFVPNPLNAVVRCTLLLLKVNTQCKS